MNQIILIAAIIAGFYSLIFCLLFSKMGYEWWRGLIPVYHFYCLYHYVWKKTYFPTVLIFSAVSIAGAYAILKEIQDVNMVVRLPERVRNIAYLLLLLIFLTNISLQYLMRCALAVRFGHGMFFAIGLMLLPILFFPILLLPGQTFHPRKKKRPIEKVKRPKKTDSLYDQVKENSVGIKLSSDVTLKSGLKLPPNAILQKGGDF